MYLSVNAISFINAKSVGVRLKNIGKAYPRVWISFLPGGHKLLSLFRTPVCRDEFLASNAGTKSSIYVDFCYLQTVFRISFSPLASIYQLRNNISLMYSRYFSAVFDRFCFRVSNRRECAFSPVLCPAHSSLIRCFSFWIERRTTRA